MKLKLFLVFSLFISSFSINAQTDKAFYSLNLDDDIDIISTSGFTYRHINVEVSNFGTEDINVHFPPGGFFVNLDSNEQNLVVLFYDVLEVKAGQKESALIGTACANPNRKPPKKGRTTWIYDYDEKLGKLIMFYHENRAIVEIATGKEHHETILKRQNFLQMCVWIYYDAEKEQILKFATTYLFNGNQESAEFFVETFYPIAVTFIDLYKRM
jgi:hypothetical protein